MRYDLVKCIIYMKRRYEPIQGQNRIFASVIKNCPLFATVKRIATLLCILLLDIIMKSSFQAKAWIQIRL